MTPNPKLVMEDNNNNNHMGSDHHLATNCLTGELGESQKFCVVDKSDSFVVDMERFSQLIEKDSNSRITLQKKLSRKGSIRNTERKVNNNERDATMLATSPRAVIFHGGCSMPEKQPLVPLGPHDHSITPQVHHHITITNATINGASTATATAAVESKVGGKRFSFRRSSPISIFDPRRILFFFATLSCMGTILLIYFTLSMGKINGDDSSLN